ncbi:MAG: nucleotidyl transferase AbiEii/AbiGii toxin family protein [Ilumatobacter sp.]|uniref:nucleotidyl transferase AbiEii/AbiGii toxin family protein n=1 Tax=Ilumatobacter sp. TaxID=1967498 RepID=UPI00391C87C3
MTSPRVLPQGDPPFDVALTGLHPLLTVEHQIAQKLHACTSAHPRTGDNDRAHDLVDLQILEYEEPLDKSALAKIATKLFTARNAQTWPPVVVSHPSWPTIYAEAADGLDVRFR